MSYERRKNEAGLFVNTRNDKSDYDAQIEIECAHCNQLTSFWYPDGTEPRGPARNTLVYRCGLKG
jgi:peptide methionine sulfoxide reductase MsrB